jgi:hypothetical protein
MSYFLEVCWCIFVFNKEGKNGQEMKPKKFIKMYLLFNVNLQYTIIKKIIKIYNNNYDESLNEKIIKIK